MIKCLHTNSLTWECTHMDSLLLNRGHLLNPNSINQFSSFFVCACACWWCTVNNLSLLTHSWPSDSVSTYSIWKSLFSGIQLNVFTRCKCFKWYKCSQNAYSKYDTITDWLLQIPPTKPYFEKHAKWIFFCPYQNSLNHHYKQYFCCSMVT